MWPVVGARRLSATPTSGDHLAIFSPDGQTLASTNRFEIILTDLVGGGSRSIDTGTAEVLSLVYSPDGSHLTSGHDEGLIKTWDVATGRQTQSLPVILATSSVWHFARRPHARIGGGGPDRPRLGYQHRPGAALPDRLQGPRQFRGVQPRRLNPGRRRSHRRHHPLARRGLRIQTPRLPRTKQGRHPGRQDRAVDEVLEELEAQDRHSSTDLRDRARSC